MPKGISKKTGKHPHWKGSKVGYIPLHQWVARQFGKLAKCDLCDIENEHYEWSNISGKYLRERSDWQRLCISCHKKYDFKMRGNRWPNSKLNKWQITRIKLIKRLNPKISQQKLATIFAVHQTTISNILIS